jgi:alkylation response protein AidB-like acyl-CoA dehydrogenase
VPSEHLIGEDGNAWQQVVSELAFERSQPDRFLSCFVLLPMLIDKLDAPDRLAKRRVGESVADLIVLREMSLSILGQLEAGKLPAQEAALVKDLGNTYEQKQPALVRELIDAAPDIRPSDTLSDALGYLTQSVPSYSLRGGTREILRGIIAKGLGL